MWSCYCSYIIGLKKTIPLFFFFKIVLSIVVPLSFHTNFRIILSICTKCFAGILIGIANVYKSVHQFGESWHLFYVESPNPRARIVFLFSLVAVQLLSCVWLFATPWTAALQTSLSFTISCSLHKLLSTESVMPSNPLILCRPFLFLPSIFPSIRVFSSKSALPIRWPKYWSFSFSISPSSEYSGLISFRIDWFDLLAVHRTLKSLLQHHSSKASILQCSVFFMVQLSHTYMTIGKTIALIIQTFRFSLFCQCCVVLSIQVLYKYCYIYSKYLIFKAIITGSLGFLVGIGG